MPLRRRLATESSLFGPAANAMAATLGLSEQREPLLHEGLPTLRGGPADAPSAGPCIVLASVDERPARGAAVEAGIAAVYGRLHVRHPECTVVSPVALRLVRLGCHR